MTKWQLIIDDSDAILLTIAEQGPRGPQGEPAGTEEIEAAIQAHEEAINPHTQYQTEAESDARYSQIGHTHTTDAVTEGSNLYFTAARVLATILTGLSTATNAVITAGDSVLSALGKLQKQISDNLNATQAALDFKVTLGDDVADEASRLALSGTPKFFHVKQSDNEHGYLLLDADRPYKPENWLDLTFTVFSVIPVFGLELDISNVGSEKAITMPSGWYIFRRASLFGANNGMSTAQLQLNAEPGGGGVAFNISGSLASIGRFADVSFSTNKVYNNPVWYFRTDVAEGSDSKVSILIEVQRIPGDYTV